MRVVSKERYALAAVAMWGVAIAVCGLILINYTTRAGRAATRSDWPADSHLPIVAGRPTVVVFLHPRCPCSDATLSELQRALVDFHGDGNVLLVFSLPKTAGQAWRQSSLVQKSADVPNALVVLDEDGIETAQFGARVSGQTMLYDADGRCVFTGGITPSRGHEGETIGRDLIRSLIVDHIAPAVPLQSAVFGCGLYTRQTKSGAQ